MADGAGLTDANGGNDYKYSNLSYEECADIIRRYVKAAPVEILKFFRIVVFNYLTLNDDAHICINTAIGRTTYLKVIPIRRPKTPLPKILRLPPLYFGVIATFLQRLILASGRTAIYFCRQARAYPL